MRVTCEKCKAVYAVDDKLIPAKGARAQCPKCKALQIVKRDAAPAAAPPPPAAAPAPAAPPPAAPVPAAAPKPASAFDALLGMVSSAPPQPPPNPPGGVPVGNPFGNLSLGPPPAGADPFGPPAATRPADDPFAALDFGAATASPASTPRPPAAAADPFAAPPAAADPFASAAPTSRQPAPPAAADPFADLDLGAGAFTSRPQAPAPRSPAPRAAAPAPAPAPAPAANPSFDDLFGATLPPPAPIAPAAAPSGPVVPCRSCKKPLPDPFDAALGICESCRNQEQKAKQAPAPKPQVVTGGAAAPSAPAAMPDPFAESADGGLELDLPKTGNAAPVRPTTNPALAAAAAAAKARAATAPKPAPMRPVASGGSGKYLAILLVLLVGGAGAYVWFARPAFLFKKVVAKPVLPVVQSRLLDWKLAVMGLQGSAAEHFAKGRKAFLADKPTSYLEAEEEFKAAVVLEPTDLKAVAFYVESYAVGRGDRAPADGLAANRELIQAVIDAEPTMSAARRAKASLQLAAGAQEVAREEASEAVRLAAPDEQAEALLTLGTVYLKTSAPIAQEKIDAALKLDKTLRRAWYYRGLANEYGGRFASALADYGERLKLDPDQREALRAQARVFARLGDYQSARKALAQFASKHPNVGEPRVLLVQLAYAVERDLREAERTLRELRNDEAKFDDLDKLQLHSLWAAVARERGDAKGAAAQADAALKIDPNWAPAHFQKMLLALQAGDAEAARQALRACEAKLDDPIRAKEYLGRIEAAAGNHDKALAAFRAAQDSAPGRMTPRLNMAALLVKRGDLDQAWTVMHRALAADPTSVAQLRRQASEYFEAPVDAIRGIPRVFESADSENNWLAQVYAAVAYYHAGDYERAERGLDRSLAADPSSMAALLYRTQLEIDRKQWNRAQAFAKRAIENERESAVAFYLMARVEEGQRKPDQARTTLLQALQRDPGLAPANTRLGMLALEADKESAKKWLLQALASDPDNLDARVALFKLGY